MLPSIMSPMARTRLRRAVSRGWSTECAARARGGAEAGEAREGGRRQRRDAKEGQRANVQGQKQHVQASLCGMIAEECTATMASWTSVISRSSTSASTARSQCTASSMSFCWTPRGEGNEDEQQDDQHEQRHEEQHGLEQHRQRQQRRRARGGAVAAAVERTNAMAGMSRRESFYGDNQV